MSDDEHSQTNETITPMIQRIEPTFAEQLDGVKYALYEKIVFTPDEETKEGQDNALLNAYTQQLTALYRLARDAQDGKEEWNLAGFPEELRGTIQSILRFICDYFKHNAPAKRIPYEHYLRSNLLTNEFVQHMYRRHSGQLNETPEESL